LRPAVLLIAAWLTLSPLLLSLNPARSDVPYFGILRGWENRDVNQIVGYDIAADESGIYIAGEFFKAPGYGPTVLFHRIVPKPRPYLPMPEGVAV